MLVKKSVPTELSANGGNPKRGTRARADAHPVPNTPIAGLKVRLGRWRERQWSWSVRDC